MDFKEKVWEGVDSINPAQDKGNWAVVDMAMNLRVPKMCGISGIAEKV
jgi:hypothetical protein